MKLEKISLSELENTELNEREMCRLLGGGTPGCCQCGCNYSGSGGGSSTSANDKANNAKGYTSDPGAHPCCDNNKPATPEPRPEPQYVCTWNCNPQSACQYY